MVYWEVTMSPGPLKDKWEYIAINEDDERNIKLLHFCVYQGDKMGDLRSNKINIFKLEKPAKLNKLKRTLTPWSR